MEVVKTEEQLQGLKPEELRPGNKFIDIDGGVSEWTVAAYGLYLMDDKGRNNYKRLSGLKIDKDIARKLGFKFPFKNSPKHKDKAEHGFLHVRPGHEYEFRPGEKLRLNIRATFQTDADLQGQQLKGNLNLLTDIEHVHELQNHAWHLYTGHEVDVSKITTL